MKKIYPPRNDTFSERSIYIWIIDAIAYSINSEESIDKYVATITRMYIQLQSSNLVSSAPRRRLKYLPNESFNFVDNFGHG